MLSFRIFIFFSSLFFCWGVAAQCELKGDDCRYYLCQAKVRNCQSQNYLKDFGYKYCQKFQGANLSRFTNNGKVWLKEVRQCLMKKLSEVSLDTTCDSLKLKAHFHHLECYYKKGFCDLYFSDREKVLELISPELKRPEVILSGLGLLLACTTSDKLPDLMSPF